MCRELRTAHGVCLLQFDQLILARTLRSHFATTRLVRVERCFLVMDLARISHVGRNEVA